MSEKVKKAATTPREQEIERLRKVQRERRTEEQTARLAGLLAEERRDRFTRLHDSRVKKVTTALRNLIRLSNPASYQYTDDEAAAIVTAAEAWAKAVRQAFAGAPKERGLFDL